MDFSKSVFVQKTKNTLLEAASEKELFGSRIIIGLSGGADSVALTLALLSLSEQMGFRILACHINHMIRGEEADRDESFARNLCKRYGIEFVSFKRDVPKIASAEKKGLEEAARDVRYEIFQSLMQSDKDLIATAHTASDNAETVLFNLIRGCGISGLSGIPKRRGNIVRPIIFASREDVEEFLGQLCEGYVTDSTNLCDDCTRNIIRHRIIPIMKELNPSFLRSTSTLSVLSSRDDAFIEEIAKSSFTDEIKVLASYSDAVCSRIIGKMYKDLCGNMLPFKHTQLIISEIKNCVKNNSSEKKSFHLPGGYTARLECGRLSIAKTQTDNTAFLEYDIEVHDGINELCDGKYLVVIEPLHIYEETKKEENSTGKFCSRIEYNKNIYSLFMEVSLFKGIIGNIRLRSGKSGDKIRISGMSKNIKKMYSAKKIPINERHELPRVIDGSSGEIIALPYVGVCDSQFSHREEAKLSLRLYKLTSRSDFTDNGQ